MNKTKKCRHRLINMGLTKLQSEIVKRHINAKLSGNWDPEPTGESQEEIRANIKRALLNGKTCRGLYLYIEDRYCSVTSMILASADIFGHLSQGYKKSITEGFKVVFKQLEIQ